MMFLKYNSIYGVDTTKIIYDIKSVMTCTKIIPQTNITLISLEYKLKYTNNARYKGTPFTKITYKIYDEVNSLNSIIDVIWINDMFSCWTDIVIMHAYTASYSLLEGSCQRAWLKHLKLVQCRGLHEYI